MQEYVREENTLSVVRLKMKVVFQIVSTFSGSEQCRLNWNNRQGVES